MEITGVIIWFVVVISILTILSSPDLPSRVYRAWGIQILGNLASPTDTDHKR